MDVIPASVDEIAVFKKAAADYYKKAGVAPAKAAELFEKYMAKVAGELGLAEQPKQAALEFTSADLRSPDKYVRDLARSEAKSLYQGENAGFRNAPKLHRLKIYRLPAVVSALKSIVK